MKASELRIGNFILNENNQIVEVDGTRITFLQDGKVKYRPIEITEEWLLKFNFINGGLGLMKSLNNDVWVEYSGKSIFITCFSALIATEKIKYIHQLQNLYFVFTGKELEIKH